MKCNQILTQRKILCLLLFSVLLPGISGCKAEENPVDALRTFYQEGKEAEATNHYINHPLTADVSDVSFPGAAVHTLPSQKGLSFTDMQRTLYHICLAADQSLQVQHPLLSLEIYSDGDWDIEPQDTLIAHHEDKILAQVCYGENQFASFLYAIKSDTLKELETAFDPSPYLEKQLDDDLPYFFAPGIPASAEEYVPLLWYDWEGSLQYEIKEGQYAFSEGSFYYLCREQAAAGTRYTLYSAKPDGTSATCVGVMEETAATPNLHCYFQKGDTVCICYEWEGVGGKQQRECALSAFDASLLDK